jgi:hypothetical protein
MRRIILTTFLLLTPLSVFAATATNPVVQSGTINYAANQILSPVPVFNLEKTLQRSSLKVPS